MSEGYADLFQRGVGLFEAGDWDAFGALITEDAGWWAMEGWLEPGPFFGRTAIVDEFRRLHESWGANRVLIDEQIEHDD